jgi:hypothetical protein
MEKRGCGGPGRGLGVVPTLRATPVLLSAVTLLSALAAQPLVAQDGPTLRGMVVDAPSGTPLSGARIRIAELRRGTLTGDDGSFELADVEIGVYLLAVEQYGYEPIEARVELRPDDEPLRIGLEPKPVMLDGISVVADRLQLMERRLTSRRRAYARSSRAFEQDRLMRSAAFDMAEFLMLEGSMTPVRCRSRRLGSLCILRRGQAVESTVYIDEAPIPGGLEQLATYQPHDLYLVEVYAEGQEIRAYTHLFMERMARRPMALVPIGVGRR